MKESREQLLSTRIQDESGCVAKVVARCTTHTRVKADRLNSRPLFYALRGFWLLDDMNPWQAHLFILCPNDLVMIRQPSHFIAYWTYYMKLGKSRRRFGKRNAAENQDFMFLLNCCERCCLRERFSSDLPFMTSSSTSLDRYGVSRCNFWCNRTKKYWGFVFMSSIVLISQGSSAALTIRGSRHPPLLVIYIPHRF